MGFILDIHLLTSDIISCFALVFCMTTNKEYLNECALGAGFLQGHRVASVEST